MKFAVGGENELDELAPWLLPKILDLTIQFRPRRQSLLCRCVFPPKSASLSQIAQMKQHTNMRDSRRLVECILLSRRNGEPGIPLSH